MIQKFDEKYASLINQDVPRTFLPNSNEDKSDIPEERSIGEGKKLTKPPKDGFIETYCKE